MSKERIRVGLIGCGYWGSRHLRVFNEIADCEVTALCEQSEAAIARQPRSFLPPYITPDLEAFLEGPIDVVVIATPARSHYKLARQALLAGKHILVEKPFTTSSLEGLQLIQLAEERGLCISVGHTYVYHPAVRYLRWLLSTGALGELHHVFTARLNFGIVQPDVDVLWDLAPHDVSILLNILQQEPLVTGARGMSCLGPSLCEIAHVDLEFLGGPFAHIYVSWLEPTKVRRFTLIGSESTVVYDDLAPGEMIRIYNKSIRLVASPDSETLLRPTYLDGEATIPLLESNEPLKEECMQFLNAVRESGRTISDGWEGLKVVRVLETAAKSLYNGGAMERLSQDLIVPAGSSGGQESEAEMVLAAIAGRDATPASIREA